MPLNVRRIRTSVFLVLTSSAGLAGAQTLPMTVPSIVPQAVTQTSGDVMRDRISKSKAFIAVRNYNAAIFELENIRKETSDPSVQGVVNVLLMNSYLEQGDFKRAQDLLNEFYASQKTTKAGATASYLAVAGQVVKGARSRAERYKALGLNTSDRMLPLEALNDLEKMRETVELVITQSKEMGADRAKSADAMGMLEEASNSRSMLARDDYDSRRWKDEVADAREKLASTRSVVRSAVNDPNASAQQTAQPANTGPAYQPQATQASMQPVAEQKPTFIRDREVSSVGTENRTQSVNTAPPVDKPIFVQSAPPTNTLPANNSNSGTPKTVAPREESRPVVQTPVQQETTAVKTTPASDAPKNTSPLEVGSLLPFATKQSPPIYPAAAKTLRTTGVVKVEVTVNETGEVAAVQKASGPMMLQAAARDAILKWRFRPFTRDGQPVKATGFISFNFNL